MKTEVEVSKGGQQWKSSDGDRKMKTADEKLR